MNLLTDVLAEPEGDQVREPRVLERRLSSPAYEARLAQLLSSRLGVPFESIRLEYGVQVSFVLDLEAIDEQGRTAAAARQQMDEEG